MFQDAVDFSQAVMGCPQSPDIRQLPIGAPLSRVHFSANRKEYERGPVAFDFAGRDQLVPAFGNQGRIAFTAWAGRLIDGRVVFAPWVECMPPTYVPVGEEFWDANHVANNLLYWDELDPRVRKWQPQPGEQIALVITTGDTRRQDVFTTEDGRPVAKWRTTVVLVPFAVGDYRFTSAPVPTPVPPPTTPPVPPAPTDWQATALQLARAVDALTERLSTVELRADARATAYTLLEEDLRRQVADLTARLDSLTQAPQTPVTVPTEAVFRVGLQDVLRNREIVAGLR